MKKQINKQKKDHFRAKLHTHTHTPNELPTKTEDNKIYLIINTL